MACAVRVPPGRGEAQEGFAQLEVAVPSQLDNPVVRARESTMESKRVVIGMDPHKRSVTIEVMDADEVVLGGGRFGTDPDGFESLLEYVRQL